VNDDTNKHVVMLRNSTYDATCNANSQYYVKYWTLIWKSTIHLYSNAFAYIACSGAVVTRQGRHST